MGEPCFVWPMAVVGAIESLPPEALARVSYADGPNADVRVMVAAEDAEDARMLVIRACPDDSQAIEIVEEESESRQLVPWGNAHEFRQAIQRVIVECIPEDLEDQFAQLMADLRNSESAEELQRQLRSLVDPAARKITEELIALRVAADVASLTRAEKRHLLRRTNELSVLLAQYLESRD